MYLIYVYLHVVQFKNTLLDCYINLSERCAQIAQYESTAQRRDSVRLRVRKYVRKRARECERMCARA